MDEADRILEHLDHAERRDQVKGGSGSRNTSEVAAGLGVETRVARRALDALAAEGRIECLGTWEDFGNVLHWRLPRAPINEPAPAAPGM